MVSPLVTVVMPRYCLTSFAVSPAKSSSLSALMTLVAVLAVPACAQTAPRPVAKIRKAVSAPSAEISILRPVPGADLCS